mmetsp:Transcript_24144/g.37923  ORF Transcript_24144/g.37923 Transcript_24144/m.37923 type:complete len:115 (-) Transcript_24144:1850-2194(-)
MPELQFHSYPKPESSHPDSQPPKPQPTDVSLKPYWPTTKSSGISGEVVPNAASLGIRKSRVLPDIRGGNMELMKVTLLPQCMIFIEELQNRMLTIRSRVETPPHTKSLPPQGLG